MKDLFDTWISSIRWKVGKFNFLPLVFGTCMDLLDVIMMTLGKYTSLGKISPTVGLTAATILYSLEPYLFFKSLNYDSLTSMNLIWDLISDILVTLVAVVWFREPINKLRWLAILLAMVSLGLFAYTEV